MPHSLTECDVYFARKATLHCFFVCCCVPKLSFRSSHMRFLLFINEYFENLVYLHSHKVHITQFLFFLHLPLRFCISHPPYYRTVFIFIFKHSNFCSCFIRIASLLLRSYIFVTLPCLMSHWELKKYMFIEDKKKFEMGLFLFIQIIP